MLMFIIANALILKHVLTEERIPQLINEAMLAAGFGPIMFLIIVNIILLIGGQFIEPSGLNLFVTAGVAQMSVVNVVRAAFPWVGIMFVFLTMITYIPIISTWLPTQLMGPEIITN